jgi:formylglycine-generating enzyme required for sulfatase activity
MIAVASHTDGFFLIGETEVTKSLYNAVTGGSDKASDYPLANVTYSTFQSFITQLCYQTSLTFSLPSKSQWLYASAGGNLSQGYTYSGSNNPDDVAWYALNSGNKVHPVKQLAPNELGIYDMSGNVREFTSTAGDSHSGVRFKSCLGGFYGSTTSDLSDETYDANPNTASAAVGFRLILTCK